MICSLWLRNKHLISNQCLVNELRIYPWEYMNEMYEIVLSIYVYGFNKTCIIFFFKTITYVYRLSIIIIVCYVEVNNVSRGLFQQP